MAPTPTPNLIVSVAACTIAVFSCSLLGLTAAKAPDTSLDTTPVAYYGANWNRSQVNIDQLAKMQMVSDRLEFAARPTTPPPPTHPRHPLVV